MSIQGEIGRLSAAKASIAASLQAMGVDPPSGTTLEQYAAQLAAIAAAAPWLSLTGGTMTGPIVLNGPPTDENHAANKQYVDGLVGDINAALDARLRTSWPICRAPRRPSGRPSRVWGAQCPMGSPSVNTRAGSVTSL